MLDRFRADWPLKLLALVLAFGIWVSITGEDHTLKDFSIPVELQLREDRISATPVPTTVTVRLEGSETAIRKLDPLRLAVRLDLKESPLGEREVQLSEPHLDGVPQGVQVAFFDPERLYLVVDRRMRRELTVIPEIVGEPPDGFHYYGAVVRPRTVEVEGPESSVNNMTELRTDPIPLNQRTRSFVVLVGAVADGPQVKTVDPDRLEVQVTIDASPIERTINAIPIVVEGGTPNARTDPATMIVTISGPPGIVRSISASEIRAVANVEGSKPDSRAQRVPVRTTFVGLPDDQLRKVTVRTKVPQEVWVRIPARGSS